MTWQSWVKLRNNTYKCFKRLTFLVRVMEQLRIKRKKTKIMIIKGKAEKTDIKSGSVDIEQVDSFKYVGSHEYVTGDMLCTK